MTEFVRREKYHTYCKVDDKADVVLNLKHMRMLKEAEQGKPRRTWK